MEPRCFRKSRFSSAVLFDDGHVLAGQIADAVEVLVRDRLGFDKLTSHAQATRSCFEEFGRGCQVNAPVGIMRICGNGPRTALKNAGPTISAGNTLTMSAPASHAARISVGVNAPGITSLSSR